MCSVRGSDKYYCDSRGAVRNFLVNPENSNKHRTSADVRRELGLSPLPPYEWKLEPSHAIDCTVTPKSELTVAATVRLDKQMQEAAAKGERWFHPHLKYGKGPKADAYRKEAEEYAKRVIS
jgi:hypothetical protein